MKVPLSWLREFVDVAVENGRLAEDLTVAGLAVDGVETHGGDTVFDLDITTNRVDCMNLYGVAREVAVLYGLPLKPLATGVTETGPPAKEALDVAIEAADLCPRFCARVLDVKMGPSPQWLQDRLEAVGVRPISNVVDLTNYVMMEMGQPTHAFDLAKIPAGKLVVRWGREGETLATLDGVERTLTARTGVVASPQGSLALAGIMGGASSEVGDATRTVALEAAYWDPLSIRRAAKALAIRTEASHRFERGADPEAPALAIARLVHLLERTGAGTARPGLLDRQAAAVPRRSARVRDARISRVLGAAVPAESTRRILTGLGFDVKPAEGGHEVAVPSWRGDVAREADLIEEVARHHGLGRLPSTLPQGGGAHGLTTAQVRLRGLRDVFVGAGFGEAVHYAFGPALAEDAVTLVNPLAEDHVALRRSLVPGLLKALDTNLRHLRRDVRLFEIGRVFAPALPLPEEETRVAFVMSGAVEAHWSAKRRPADFYDAKGIVEALARRLGVTFDLSAEGVPDVVHPGKSASVRWEGRTIGYVGSLHPDRAAAWELKEEACVGELALDALLERPAVPPRFAPLPRFPPVARDVSAVCGEDVSSATLLAWVREAAGPQLREAAVVDRYDKPPIPKGKVSLTVSLRYQDPARTLTSEEVQASVDAVTAALRGRGADIRGE